MAPADSTERSTSLDPVEHDEERGARPAQGGSGPEERGLLSALRHPGPPASELIAPAGSLLQRPALMVAADATVAEAARAMREAGTGAVLVDAPDPGIVTDRDLRNRVVAEGLPADVPAAEVMSRPLRTVSYDTPLHDVLLLMVDADIHHVPVTDGGRIVGVVSDKDLLRRQARGPLLLLERIRSLERLEALDGYALEIAATAGSMLENEVEPVRISRVIASLNDSLTAKLLRLAEEDLGPPPCPYAWLALGSEGRMEQLLVTDQDNAMAYERDDPEAQRYFAGLAERVVGGLLKAGFPSCPGGYMATNWRGALPAWEERFRGWIVTPQPQALLEAEVFFDFRRAHGTLTLEPLDRVLAEAADRSLFLFHMARAALRFRPPLRLFGRVRAEQGELDLKRGGLAAIVLIGRLYGLAARSRARSTLERLRDGVEAGLLGRAGSEALADAFRHLNRLRLRAQLTALAEGREPTNAVRLDELSDLEQRRLREALRAVADAQKGVALRFRVHEG